jgi:hypothetical protein
MSLALALLAALSLAVQQPAAPAARPPSPNGLPVLNVVRAVKLGPTYSCRSKEEVESGYGTTSLWLSDYSRGRNEPDLLFDGACGGRNYFVASTAGDDMALVADLGPNVSLATVTRARAMNYSGVQGPERETRFSETALVVVGHTYVVTLNKADVRGLFALTVTRFQPDEYVEFNYVVLNYAVTSTVEQATP